MTSPPKPAAPAQVQAAAVHARRRLAKGHVHPGVAVEANGSESFVLASPHDDEGAWEALICAALGTRSISTAKTFIHSLTQLCAQTFVGNEGNGGWRPDEFELNMVLNIATSIKPRNEMEAALAAQMTAVHMMTMKTAAMAIDGWGTDNRAAALAAKLARTFSLQWDTLMRHRGKRRTTRQTITVSQEKHIHHHRHVHLEGGGSEIGDQAYGPNASVIEGRAALSGPNASGIVVPMPRKPRQSTV